MFRSITPGAINVKGAFEETLNYAKMGGFEGMDGGLSPMAEMAKKIGVDGIKAQYQKAGLRLGVMSLGAVMRAGEAEHDDFLKRLPAMAKVAKELDTTGCVTWLPPKSDTLRFRDNFRFHLNRLRPVARVLKDNGLRLGLEPVGPHTSREGEGYGFLYTMAGVLALTEAIGTGNVGLLVDSWHWYNGLGTAADLAMLTAEDVVHVHINDAPAGIPVDQQKDNSRAIPGETGIIDLKTFLGALKKIGYQGAVTPEPNSPRLKAMSSEEAAKTVGDALQKVWKDAGI